MQPQLFFVKVNESNLHVKAKQLRLLRFTVIFVFKNQATQFSKGQTHLQWECYGHFYNSIKISIFKTLRKLDTTWNFAGSITRVVKEPKAHWKWVWPEKENTVNLKSASFILIMLLHEGLTRIRSQKKLRLHCGESLASTTFLFIISNHKQTWMYLSCLFQREPTCILLLQ